jgi:small ligand-binding sensory domain FIST
MAAGLVVAQLRAQIALPQHASKPPLGIVYFTDHYADEAQSLLDHLRQELPDVSDWVGTVGVGISANNVEYFDEPALAVMLCDQRRGTLGEHGGLQTAQRLGACRWAYTGFG